MKIAFISDFPPSDRKKSSGTNYKMAESLRAIGEIFWIQPKKRLLSIPLRIFCRLWNKISTKKINIYATQWGTNIIYKDINTTKINDCDIAVAFFCMSNLSKLKDINIPILYFSDTVFPAMIDYYPEFSNLYNWNIKEGLRMEKKALGNATLSIFSSEWAAKFAINDLNIPQEKIRIIEFGANIDDFESGNKKIFIDGYLNLLFLGVDWERKGGKIACDTVIWLNKMGINSQLHIIGLNQIPSEYRAFDYINVYGFLDKNKTEDYSKFISIIKSSDLLILPTFAECAGIAFAEACAYKIPIITHDTGGIPNYVINGISGYRLPLGSSSKDFANKIREIVESGEINQLRESSYNLYKQKLNWGCWEKKVKNTINQILESQKKKIE